MGSLQLRLATLCAAALALGAYAQGAVAQGAVAPSPAAPPAAHACLAPAAWHRLGPQAPQPMPSAEALAFAAGSDVVLLGERHDSADHHAWQLQTLAALHALRPRMVLGFEAFPRRVQAVLDQWVAGELSESQFLEKSDYDKVWSLPSRLYLPLFQFARLNRIPMLALNVERELTQQVTQKGWDGVPVERREGVSRPAPATQAYRDSLFEIYKLHPRAKEKGGAASPGDADFQHFIDSQTTWDRAMAQALAQRLRAAPVTARPLAVGILGTGHVRSGHGVPHQLRDLGIANIATFVPVAAEDDCKNLTAGFADAVFALPSMPEEAPPRPRLGISLQRTDKGVEVSEVRGGSLAEASGIRKGDAIVSIAGVAVTQVGSVIAAVRAQPAGTWLPLSIRREAVTLELTVKFPSQP